jgi:hypothetical protein
LLLSPFASDEFPIHVVCEWIGNSPDVARKHSITVTDDHFARAAGEKAAQNPAQSVHAASRTDSHDESETAAPLAFAGGAAVAVPPRGVERTGSSPGETPVANPGDPFSGPNASLQHAQAAAGAEQASGRPTDWVEIQISNLPPEVLAALWTMFRAGKGGLHSTDEA